jgi:hypothetical protein
MIVNEGTRFFNGREERSARERPQQCGEYRYGDREQSLLRASQGPRWANMLMVL